MSSSENAQQLAELQVLRREIAKQAKVIKEKEEKLKEIDEENAKQAKVIKEKDEENAKQAKVIEENVALANGTFFAQLSDVIGIEKVSYSGGFLAISGRMNTADTQEEDVQKDETMSEAAEVVNNATGKAENTLNDTTEERFGSPKVGVTVVEDDAQSEAREHVAQADAAMTNPTDTGTTKVTTVDKRFPEYIDLEADLLAKVNNDQLSADDATFETNSFVKSINSFSSSINASTHSLAEGPTASSEDKPTTSKARKDKHTVLIGASGTDVAHLLPGNKTCSSTMGIFVQTIVGTDFEAKMDKKISETDNTDTKQKLQDKKKSILRSLAYHRRVKREPIGFCHLTQNKIRVPKNGHQEYFDRRCTWIIVPIMPLQEIIDWHFEQGGYWVMFIAGVFQKDEMPPAEKVKRIAAASYQNFLPVSTNGSVYIQDTREQCTQEDVIQGLANLEAFIKAFADLATGRGENKLTPLDLFSDQPSSEILDELRKAQEKLKQGGGKVSVPRLKDYYENGTEIMKIFLKNNDKSKLPEPMAIAAKGALNFMKLNDEKAIPSWHDQSNSQVEDEESNISFCDGISFQTPIQMLMGSKQMLSQNIPEFVSIVTPPPCSSTWEDDEERNDGIDDTYDDPL